MEQRDPSDTGRTPLSAPGRVLGNEVAQDEAQEGNYLGHVFFM